MKHLVRYTRDKHCCVEFFKFQRVDRGNSNHAHKSCHVTIECFKMCIIIDVSTHLLKCPSFCSGSGQEVGRSCHFLEFKGKKVLVSKRLKLINLDDSLGKYYNL